MSLVGVVPETSTPRRSQRQPLSCSRCARSKIRCSKTIPCLSCIDRGQETNCRRETVEVSASRKRIRTRNTGSADTDHVSQVPIIEEFPQAPSPDQEADSPSVTADPSSHSAVTRLDSPATSDSRLQPCIPRIQNDAVITLEFLSHGRQSILHIGDTTSRKQPNWTRSPVAMAIAEGDVAWDPIFTFEQINLLLAYHQDTIAWMHNVIHMPTFCNEFNEFYSRIPDDRSWIALYYALMCTTIYHGDEGRLLEMGISSSTSLVQMLYNKSIQHLHEANFMAVHRLTSVQTVCVLLQVAYNLDQSDLIQVLLSTAIRIAQSLALHRLGPDREGHQLLPEGMTATQFLIDREVKKRNWWFLVRQDWLQIPFQNTFAIHASQFNTPMPLNCYEEESEMVRDGKIVVQPETTFTQSSYSNEIHKVAIVIWKHQDRMCAAGHPGTTREGVLRLYNHTLWADTELKQRYKDMPVFFHSRHMCSLDVPDHVEQLSSVLLLSTAHKIHTVHRYFQLRSFQDKNFAFTQQSCVAVSQRCIKDVEAWPANTAARMALKMWTVITHIITSCVNLTFASMFRNENTLLYDGPEMQRLSRAGREAIRPAEEWSSIARRGGALLDALFDIEDSLCRSDQVHFRIEDIVEKVLQVDDTFRGDFSLAPEIAESHFDFNINWSLN